MDINESAKSFGSTVRKKIENAETIIVILKIIDIANVKDMKNVFKIIIKINKKDKPLILFSHFLKILPEIIKGIKLRKIIKSGTIVVNNKALMVYIIVIKSLHRGSILCKKVFFFMNLNALRNSKPIY